MIQNQQMTRVEALDHARAYDGEFPSTHFAENLDYLSLADVEFAEIVDKHRNPEIWAFEGNQWRLRYPPQ